MPTYQYACTACGHRFEAVQSFSDASLSQCPECSGRLRKLFGSVGVVFKGSGFYRTDSRSEGSEGKAKSEATASETSPTPAKTAASSSSESSAKSSSSSSTSTSSSSTSSSGAAAAAS